MTKETDRPQTLAGLGPLRLLELRQSHDSLDLHSPLLLGLLGNFPGRLGSLFGILGRLDGCQPLLVCGLRGFSGNASFVLGFAQLFSASCLILVLLLGELLRLGGTLAGLRTCSFFDLLGLLRVTDA